MLVALLILLVLFAVYVWMLHPNVQRRDMSHLATVDYAHRGLWNDERPENSLTAFAAAVKAGYGIELDVHRTKDGVLVVHHDDSLKRMCGIDKKIAQSTLAEVRACRLLNTSEQVPTFDEVLETVDGRVPLIVELKAEANIEEVSSAVSERMKRYEGQWCMESFDPRCVQWFRRNDPTIIRGQLAYGLHGKKNRTFLDYAIASLIFHMLSRPDFLAYDFSSEAGVNLPVRLVRLMHPWMVAWTIRSQEELDRCRTGYDIAIFERFVPPTKNQQ